MNLKFIKKNYIVELSNLVTSFYSKKILKIPELKFIDLVGFHGQTIYHNLKVKKSIQLGSPQLLSNLLKKN